MTERTDVGIQNQGLEENFPFRITFRAIADLKSWEAGTIFVNIFRSSEFLDTFGWLKGLLSFDDKGAFTPNHRSALAAYLFEQFAYRLVELRLAEIPIGKNLEYGVVEKVLSWVETFELLRIAFPRNRIFDAHMGLGLTLAGFRNPDGLLIGRQGRETVLRGVCEYTLQPIINPFGIGAKRRQLMTHGSAKVIRDMLKDPERRLMIGQHLHSSNPNFPKRLSSNSQDLLFVYVRPPTKSPDDQYSERIVGNSVHICSPLRREQFYLVVDCLIADTLAKVAEEPVSAD